MPFEAFLTGGGLTIIGLFARYVIKRLNMVEARCQKLEEAIEAEREQKFELKLILQRARFAYEWLRQRFIGMSDEMHSHGLMTDAEHAEVKATPQASEVFKSDLLNSDLLAK